MSEDGFSDLAAEYELDWASAQEFRQRHILREIRQGKGCALWR